MVSNKTSVALLTYTLIAPFVPAGTTAAFAATAPLYEFSVDAFGIACPVGHVVRYPSGPGGTTVKFNEYAAALTGIPQELAGMLNVR